MRPGFMLDHMFTRRHLAEYLDGELDARGRDRLRDHAHRCPSCHRLVATLVQMLDGLRGLGQAAADGVADLGLRHRASA
jgi:anti-sigma factor RsiW